MPIQSDLAFDASKLQPGNVSEQTRQLNEKLMQMMKEGPQWFEVGAAKYRSMREKGETSLPGLTLLPEAQAISLPSRDPTRQIPCRVFRPRNADTPPTGLLYHIHGGGWVLGSEYGQDPLLQYYADHAALVVVSVGYRLAPEHPYPAGNEDCFDVAEYLVDRAERDYGVPMAFVAGESAGAHLAAATVFRLRETRPHFHFKAAVLSYGCFNLSAAMLPQTFHFDLPLVLTREIMNHYLNAYLSTVPLGDRSDPQVSPFYADLQKMKLPPAFFLCGTLDPLLDDSIMMSTKWAMAGFESILKLYPGAPHGFNLMPPGGTETTQNGLDDAVTFMREKS